MVGGSALSIAPGEDVRYLLASLVVVIVGGMGSIPGAAIGALLIGLAEQIGLVYFPTYGIVLTFVIMVVTLAVRPQGIMGKAAMTAVPARRAPPPTGRRRSAPATRGLAVALLLYPAGGLGLLRCRRSAAYSLINGMLGALADGARRLWRHGRARADHRGGGGGLRRGDPRRQQHRRARLRLALVAGGAPRRRCSRRSPRR